MGSKRKKVRGVLVMNNERAPRGWVEIQRDDDPSCVGIGDTVFESDEDAALAIALAAGMPGAVWSYVCTGDGLAYDPVVVVPAVAARMAGLITRKRELEAYEEET